MTAPTFPTLAGVSFPAKRTPLWSTLHQETVSGKDTPLALWSYPRRRFELPYDCLRSDNVNLELQTLEGFFNQCFGSAAVFQFNDPDDNAVTGQQFGIGNGITSQFQLVRTFGGFVEPVFAPTGTPVIKVNGIQSSSFTIGATGLVTFTSIPGAAAVLTWTGSYNWLCRFDDDSVEFEKFLYQIYQLGKIAFTSVKL